MDFEELQKLINEWLLTLDNETNEEYYNSDRGHATKWIELFIDWLKENPKK